MRMLIMAASSTSPSALVLSISFFLSPISFPLSLWLRIFVISFCRWVVLSCGWWRLPRPPLLLSSSLFHPFSRSLLLSYLSFSAQASGDDGAFLNLLPLSFSLSLSLSLSLSISFPPFFSLFLSFSPFSFFLSSCAFRWVVMQCGWWWWSLLPLLLPLRFLFRMTPQLKMSCPSLLEPPCLIRHCLLHCHLPLSHHHLLLFLFLSLPNGISSHHVLLIHWWW